MVDHVPDPRLRELIDEAMQVVMNSRWHDLGFGRQQAIWRQLSAGLTPEIGHRRRALLAIASVRRVLPVWRRAQPHSDLAARALFLAEGVLDGRVSPEDGEQLVPNLTTELDNVTAGASGGWVWVGYGAVVALDQAIDDLPYLNGPPPPDPSDCLERLDIECQDPIGRDAAFHAAAAMAGGPVWEPASSARRRRRFWEWWLTEAVPAALASVPQTTTA